MKKLTALVLVVICMLGLSSCNQRESSNQNKTKINAKLEVVDIHDGTKDIKDLMVADALEYFFEDENNKYYFSAIISQYIIVTYNDGTSEDIASAFKNGKVTIADLDKFDIDYYTESKSE